MQQVLKATMALPESLARPVLLGHLVLQGPPDLRVRLELEPPERTE